MPVTPDYTWQQTETVVKVIVNIPGLTRGKPDVFATSALVKVVASPYLLIVDLKEDVISDSSTAVIAKSKIIFTLTKATPGLWDTLASAESKDAVLRRRNASINEAHAHLEQLRQAKVERKKAAAKAATDRQIELDRRKRYEIEAAQNAELAAERADLHEWQQRLQNENIDESDEEEDDAAIHKEAAVEAADEPAMPDHPHYYGKGYQRPQAAVPDGKSSAPEEMARGEVHTRTADDIWDDAEPDCDSSDSSDDDGDGPEAGDALVLLPPPRAAMEPVKVDFTKLEFAHLPARANREDEIKVWKKKQADAIKMADSVDLTDRQPIFLKDKGDALFKQCNYYGAINAYSRAIDIDGDTVLALTCRLNRAACRLKLEEFSHCIMDCDQALEVLEKAKRAVEEERHSDSEGWRKQYVKALARRAMAQTRIGETDQAIADLREALRYDRDNAQLAGNLDELLAGKQPADKAGVRERAKKRFQRQDFAAAADAYTSLLEWPGATCAERATALGNRAQCWLNAGRFERSLADCDAALRLWLGRSQGVAVADVAAWLAARSAASQHDGASEDELAVMKLLARQAASHAHLRQYAPAEALYRASCDVALAIGCEHHHAALQADLERVVELGRSEAADHQSVHPLRDKLPGAAPTCAAQPAVAIDAPAFVQSVGG